MKQKEDLKKTTKEVYSNLSLEDVPSGNYPVSLPKDLKQVSNSRYREKEKRPLSSDDIAGLYLINDELKGYVEKLELLSDFFVVVIGKDMINLFTNIATLKGCILYYDTTFNVEDFYVSPLTFSNHLFNHGNASTKPIIPLGYLLHHTKKQEVHEEFFRHVRILCPTIVGRIIVTDRKQAIVNAIKKHIPENVHFFCWNHIQQDIRNWVKNKRIPIKMMQIYTPVMFGIYWTVKLRLHVKKNYKLWKVNGVNRFVPIFINIY